MTDNEIIKIGDICAYFYDNQNKSFSIVEVVEELSDECVVVKFHQVLRDDSGNGFFTYLCDKGKTMNVSRKYLNKIDLINRQKAEIERFEKIQKPTEVSGFKIENGKVVFYTNMLNSYRNEYKNLDEVVRELNFMLENAYKSDEVLSHYKGKLQQAKSEAIKEFAERLKKHSYRPHCSPSSYKIISMNSVNNLVKEMTEG